MEAVMEGRDVVALMPTGGGKSLCYQLLAVVFSGLTVVVSPLIALMKDQVDTLRTRGISATFINSTLSQNEIKKAVSGIKKGEIKMLYIAPERLAAPAFSVIFSELEIDFLAVDEAHCVSQWGHDFRPDYLNIKKHIKKLARRPIVAAFIATATPEVKKDIIERLELKNPAVFVRGFDRSNLKFFCETGIKSTRRHEEVLRIIKTMRGAGIVYALSRKETENISEYLKKNGVNAAAYHAGMEGMKREKIQNDFMENRIRVIVATIAFGMGVDKSDVRFVIHSGMPGSLEGYYQEAGRAGRDGEKSFCILLHSKKDSFTHKFFIRSAVSEMYSQGKGQEEVRRVSSIKYDRLEKMERYARAKRCRRKIILEYFNDPEIKNHSENCQGCDVCLGWERGNIEKHGGSTEKNIRTRNDTENADLTIGATVLETLKLYQKGYVPAQIAKIWGLGAGTIFDHLVQWYSHGG